MDGIMITEGVCSMNGSLIGVAILTLLTIISIIGIFTITKRKFKNEKWRPRIVISLFTIIIIGVITMIMILGQKEDSANKNEKQEQKIFNI